MPSITPLPAPLPTGHLLGGRVRYRQTSEGFRSGIEPILLAAAIPARSGDGVLEGGTGAGAALLCLAARVADVRGVGVERDPMLVQLAAENARANGFAGLRFIAGDVESLGVSAELPKQASRVPSFRTMFVRTPPPDPLPQGEAEDLVVAHVLPHCFDHACANPPYHDPDGTRSPSPARDTAKRGSDGLLAGWAAALGRCLRPRGTLTFILRAAQLPACLHAMETAGCRASAILPLWPKQGQACKLTLVHGVKGGRAKLRVLAGLVLHDTDGRFTEAAEAILRRGDRLSLD